MTLPSVFPFLPDPTKDPEYEQEWLTDVMSAASDTEVRQALRQIAVRTLRYLASFGQAADTAEWRHMWYAALQPLRYLVPIWVNSTLATAIAGDAISGSFAGREFVAGQYAALYTGSTNIGIVKLVDVSDDLLTTEEDVAGTFPIGITRVAPCMVAWLTPPTLLEQSAEMEQAELEFIEELPGVSGIDADVGSPTTAVPASIDLFFLEGIQPYRPLEVTVIAIVRDVSGTVIPDWPLTWTVDVGEIAVSVGTHSVRWTVEGDGFLTADAGGGITATIHVITL